MDTTNARLLTAAELRAQVDYDPMTGLMTRKVGCKGSWIGRPIGTKVNGTYRAMFGGVFYQVPRLAVLFMTGEWPNRRVRAVNGNRYDLRWENLDVLAGGITASMQKLIRYEEDTGEIYWRINGERVPTYFNEDGRGTVYVLGRRWVATHVIWYCHFGIQPRGLIDHINGDPRDNRLENLRDVDPQGNRENLRAAMSNNKSGYLGVDFHKKEGRWRASIKYDGKKRHIGYFDDPEKAHEAYLAKKREVHPCCSI